MLGQIAALRNTCNITVKDVIDLPTYRKSIVVGFNTLLCVRVFLLYCFNCIAVYCSSKIQIGFTFLVPAYPGCSGKEAVKWLFVCFVVLTVLQCAY